MIPNCFYRISIKWLIIDNKWKFMLCKEKSWVWELPWGWLDHGENPHDWLRREFDEELWVKVKNISKNPSYFLVFENGKNQPASNIIYKVECDFEDLKNIKISDECVEIWFFDENEAAKLNLLPNVAEFIKQYKI